MGATGVNCDDLIDQEKYEKQREGLLKYFIGDVVMTTKKDRP